MATIYMEKGEPVEAEIISSDIDKVYVKEVSGVERSIARAEIADVEHPSGTMVGGGVMIGAGVVLAIFGVVGVSDCAFNIMGSSSPDGPLCGPGLFGLLVGIPTAIVGIPVTMAGSGIYFKSIDNLTADSPATSARPDGGPGWGVAPLVTRDERGMWWWGRGLG